jgi:phosphoenolpyruvate synthase/pyruvate phosphate dikinase
VGVDMVGYRSFFFFFFGLYTFMGQSIVQAQDLASFYGNKYANLVKLNDILVDEPGVTVPAFIGIDTNRIETFLRLHDPYIFDDYQKAIIELNKNRSFVGNCINRVLYAIGFKSRAEDLLQNVQRKISQYLSSTNKFDFSPDETVFFANVEADSQYLMVRSTGIEDSQTVANAGGNVSIAYVQPVEWKVQEGMKQVVASYFSMQSLKNRISGGEQLSADTLCLPVLIQLLVGEPLGGSILTKEIPISGVAFTTNLNISAPDFPIMEINAAYGHGEGVVANRVAADRYYITPPRTAGQAYAVYPVVSYKGQRLVAQEADNVGNHALVAINNSADLAQKRALSEKDIERLYNVLKKIETAYGQPMDVEFVILDSELYIVQARPAMHSEITPSYITLEHVAENTISEHVSVIRLVTGQSKVVQISDAREIIIAKTLDGADQMPNSAVCKAVFVENWAASLSHAAVNFMSHGIPCFYISDINILKKVVNRASVATPIIIDVQRRTVFLWQGEQLIPITTGWFEHPIVLYRCVPIICR